ncbi:MAG: hypothetical protein LBR26_11895 [Prevotella sp.]|jgi:hypothetical protein|nr:hypothetical protein [Prevotella sp.]
MKKMFKLLGLIVLLGGVTLVTSCSKKKTCECTVTVTVMGYTSSQTATGEIEDGDCEDIPELQDLKNSLGSLGTIDVSCREI